MPAIVVGAAVLVLVTTVGVAYWLGASSHPAAPPPGAAQPGAGGQPLALPAARIDSSDIARAIHDRRSVRIFGDRPLELAELSDLLWATIGITVDAVSGPTRAAPSAGATDPLVVYAAVRHVKGLTAGLYRYQPVGHGLSLVSEGDLSQTLAAAALGQAAIAQAPAVLILAADYARTTARYGERGQRYVHFEVGHAAQNAALVAQHLGLGSVMIGAFDDGRIRALLGSGVLAPLLLIPVGPR